MRLPFTALLNPMTAGNPVVTALHQGNVLRQAMYASQIARAKAKAQPELLKSQMLANMLPSVTNALSSPYFTATQKNNLVNPLQAALHQVLNYGNRPGAAVSGGGTAGLSTPQAAQIRRATLGKLGGTFQPQIAHQDANAVNKINIITHLADNFLGIPYRGGPNALVQPYKQAARAALGNKLIGLPGATRTSPSAPTASLRATQDPQLPSWDLPSYQMSLLENLNLSDSQARELQKGNPIVIGNTAYHYSNGRLWVKKIGGNNAHR